MNVPRTSRLTASESPGGSTTGPISKRAERVLFWSLLALSALPTLIFEYFPSQDGPAHVGNGAVISHSGSPIFAEYFEVALSQGTNLLADMGLAGLLPFVSAPLADKVMALLLLVGLPLAVRFCLRQLDPVAAWLSILAIPLGAGLFVYYGFYNFLLGVIASFFAFGFWLRRMKPGRARPADWVVFTLLIALVYLSHPLPLLALLVMVGAAITDEVHTESGWTSFTSLFLRRFAPVLLVAVIPLGSLIAFGSSRSTEILYVGSPVGRLAKFLFAPIMALSGSEIPFAVLPAAAIGLLCATILRHDRRAIKEAFGFLIAVGVLAGLYFMVPNAIGEGTLIPPRVALYLVVFALFWLAGRHTPPWAKVTALVVGSVAVAGLAVVRIPIHADLNAEIAEYLSGQTVVEPGSTVLPLWGVEPQAAAGGRVVPRHMSAYLMATGEIVDLHHFVAQLSISPVRFRNGYRLRDLSPSSDFGDLLILGPDLVDFDEYVSNGPGRIDYIWMWRQADADPATRREPSVQALSRLLDDDYELLFVSSRGLLEVYGQKATG